LSSETILRPRISSSVFIAEGARIYGDVQINDRASIWFNAVIRGDEGPVLIECEASIQDNVVVHSDLDYGVYIGNKVNIGHGAVIRGCLIEDNVMVGMNATIMTSAEIGAQSIVGANAMIGYGKKFPPCSLILGVPAQKIRELTERELEMNDIATATYQSLVKRYLSGEIKSY
jgi:carbonic anhydrase/acetyltransferase-like protein (isoleucine patch superfamily)